MTRLIAHYRINYSRETDSFMLISLWTQTTVAQLTCFKNRFFKSRKWYMNSLDATTVKQKKKLALKTFKLVSLRNTQSRVVEQAWVGLSSKRKSVQILPPFVPCDWSLPVSVRGRGTPLISICLYVNLGLRLPFFLCGWQQQETSVDLHYLGSWISACV